MYNGFESSLRAATTKVNVNLSFCYLAAQATKILKYTFGIILDCTIET